MYNRALEQALKVSQAPSDTTSVLSEVSNASDTISKDKEDEEFIPDNGEPVSSEEEEVVSDESDDSDFNSPPPAKSKSIKKRQKSTPAIDRSKRSLSKASRTTKDKAQANMTSNSVTATGTPKEFIVPEANLKVRKTIQKATGHSTPKSYPPPRTSIGPSTPDPCQPLKTSSVSRNTPTIGIGRKVPKWTPPSRVGEGSVVVKSPSAVNSSGTPVIRIGLSKHARVKPLHVNRT